MRFGVKVETGIEMILKWILNESGLVCGIQQDQG